MNIYPSRFSLPLLCLAVALTGCASTPEVQTAAAGDDLRNKNMDVLFATEFPVASMDEALSIAAQSQAAGDIDKAIFFYVRALQFDESNVKLLTHIGDIHMHRGDSTMARRAFGQAIRHDPGFAPALEALGLIDMTEGRDEDAISRLSQSIAADQDRWRAHNALGVFADKDGDHDKALSHYRTALNINPDAAHVLANVGYSRFLAGDVEGAIADLRDAADQRGFDAAWGNLARVYASQGFYEDAVVAFSRVMSDANAYSATGKIAMENGDLHQAFYLLSEAVGRSSVYFPEAEESLRKLRAQGVTSAPIHITARLGNSSHE